MVVALSGGLDSRLIIALVPELVECIAVTFCDKLNREMRTAAKVAKCYTRPWFPHYRDPEHVAYMAEPAIRLIGCEGWFLYAHAVGLTEKISQHRAGSVLNGLMMNRLLRCSGACDIVRVPRWAGLLPPRYVQQEIGFVSELNSFWTLMLQESVAMRLRVRRESFAKQYGGEGRTSMAEWLYLYPVTGNVPRNDAN